MKFLEDIKYTIKMMRGILSGFDDLQVKAEDGWEYVEYKQFVSLSWDGKRSAGIEYDLPDYPYYVCAAWKNHTHTPLPILIDAESEYPIQNAMVKALHWMWTALGKCPAGFEAAVVSCAYYERQFNDQDIDAEKKPFLSEDIVAAIAPS